jgi:hypothetical protein
MNVAALGGRLATSLPRRWCEVKLATAANGNFWSAWRLRQPAGSTMILARGGMLG